MEKQTNLFDTSFESDLSPNRLKELPETFIGRSEARGFEFNLVKRSNKAYIFEVLEENCPKRYEIFSRKEDRRFGKIAYPKSNAFGVWAWTTRIIEKAYKYFDRLNTEEV